MINRYDTITLLSMIEEIEQSRTPWLSMFYPNESFSDTQFIEWDMVLGGRRLAPFVSPMVQGMPIASEGHVTRQMKPAYIKMNNFVSPTDALHRMAGEGYLNEQRSPMTRMNMLMAQKLATHQDMITQRLEWMAIMSIVNGQYVVDGPSYQRVVVDFQHDPALRIALAGAALWNLATSTPIEDIEDAGSLIRQKSRGVVPNVAIFGTDAWQSFRGHADVKDRINTDIRRANTTRLDDGMMMDQGELEWVGNLDGRMDLYRFEGYYLNEDGVDTAFMDPTQVVICRPDAIQGVRHFGAILDSDAQLQPLMMFSKSRTAWDPTGEELLTQSAPLVAPRRANSWAVIDVQ